MIIAIVKERKEEEYRVAATDSHVHTMVQRGHQVLVEEGAGLGAGIDDEAYRRAGAQLVTQAQAWEQADLVFKVKEPIAEEYRFFRPGLAIFAYFHLAADRALAQALVDKEVTAIAYETVEKGGRLPLLTPMSEIGGCIAVHDGAYYLSKTAGGKGVLLQGLPGVAPAHVVVVGGGVAGTGAVRTALGIGARVSVLDINVARLAQLADIFGPRLETLYANEKNLAKAVATADLVVGAVLVPGARAPQLISRAMVQSMEPGGVIVDISIDQGSTVETMDHATSHRDPVYVREGILHYAVANIPGKVPMTASQALSNVTVPYCLEILDQGLDPRLWLDSGLRRGVNSYQGRLVYPALVQAFADLPGQPW